MDKLEKWYKDHKEALDTLEPGPEIWEGLDTRLNTESGQAPRKGYSWLSGGAVMLVLLLFVGLTTYRFDYQSQQGADRLPDISLVSPEGKTVALSSLKGKVVLLEFWASWCNVCREKNCDDLLPIYDAYKNQNFEIYAVSLDSVSDQWLLGIERDSLPWIQVSDLKGFASPVSQSYGIDRTHTTFLLNQNHQVIGKNLSREELEGKLNACFRAE